MIDPKEEMIAGALRSEAARHSPAFSETLHQRILRQIHSAPAAPADRPLRLPAWTWLPAVAAALLVAIWAWHDLRPPAGNKTNIWLEAANRGGHVVPPLEQFVGRAAATADLRLQQTLESGAMAYLDQDARQLAQFMVQRVSVLPKKPARNNL